MIIMHSCDITEHGEFHAFSPSLPRYLEQAESDVHVEMTSNR